MTKTQQNNNENQLDLDGWVRHLNEEEMPVFAHTARGLAAATGQVDTPVAELAHWILQDSAMTARVLRMANSVYYNPAGNPICTVSMSVLMLGYDTVCNIALSIAMIDTLLKGIQHDHVVNEMARSFHAAVQAKSIAIARGLHDVEEIYIAALLYRLGHMAFWCFPMGLEKKLDIQYLHAKNEEEAERKILGFSLRELTLALNKEWNLSPLLTETLLNETASNESVKDLEQGYKLVHAVEQGWGSVAVKNVVSEISERISLSREETLEMIHKSSHQAAQTAAEFGAITASKRIHLPNEAGQDVQQPQTNRVENQMMLQMNVMRELTGMLNNKVDVNAILGTILEGIYRALGMERTVLAFLTPDGSHLKSKYILSEDRDDFEYRFNFYLPKDKDDIFSYALKNKDPIWIGNPKKPEIGSLLTPDIKRALGTSEFFLFPLSINDVAKGVIYADCKFSERPLDEQDFFIFTHFCNHANIAFKLL